MPDEFTVFCDAENPRLVGAITLWCGSREVAEEVVQDAFARAYRAWYRIRQLDRPGAWVRRVAINLATSRFRRWRAERRANRRHTGRRTEPAQPPDIAAAVAVRQALGHLPASQRTVLVLRYYLDLPVTEVAELTGRSASAVTSLTGRALDALGAHVTADPTGGRQELGHE